VSRAAIGALLVVLVCGCTQSRPVDLATAKQDYLAAKSACIARYPDKLTEQSDCRAKAADTYIRPFYRYGDLMTRAQEQRRALAVRADRHEISRRQYNRDIARSDAEIAREEDRRNSLQARGGDKVSPSPLNQPIASLFR
jgi:hypothetical protein